MENSRIPLCIYHFACADGFGAAWSVRSALGKEVEFYGAGYGAEPPDVAGRDVIMVDFSYKRTVLERMAHEAHSILILDHHKTARDDLAGLPVAPEFGTWKAAAWTTEVRLSLRARMAAIFDMERSGAGLAWDYFHPGVGRPTLINHIEDRDLWRFALPLTREIQAAVFSYPYDFEVWDGLVDQAERNPAFLAQEGMAIERKHFKDIDELVGATKREMIIGGIVVPVANLPYTLTSDAGNLMAKQHSSKIGVCHLDTSKGRTFSLRSLADGPDVSEIAKRYGGGGHAHAAGFIMPLGWEGEAAMKDGEVMS